MPPTSVMPFQHFLAPGQSNGLSPSNKPTQNLFASSPFDDDKFHHPRHSFSMAQPATATTASTQVTHHHSSSSASSSHHNHNSNNNHHQHDLDPSSPSTPRTYHNNNSMNSSSDPTNGAGHRWDPSPSALDEVSRGGPASPLHQQQQQYSQSQSSFTLPPIVPNGMGTPRMNGMNGVGMGGGPMSAGSEWDGSAPHYATAQWGAYSSSGPGGSGDSPSSPTSPSYGYDNVGSSGGPTGNNGGNNSPPSYALTPGGGRYGGPPPSGYPTQHHQQSPYGAPGPNGGQYFPPPAPPSQGFHPPNYALSSSSPAPAFLNQGNGAGAPNGVLTRQNSYSNGSNGSVGDRTTLPPPAGVMGMSLRPTSSASSSRDLSDESGSGDGGASGSGSVASAYFATSNSLPPPGPTSYGTPSNTNSSYSSHHATAQHPHYPPHNSHHASNSTPTSATSSHSHSLSNGGSITPVSSPGTTNMTSPSGQPSIKPKRRRADANQLRTLNATYDRTAFPSTEERAELARKLGMTPRQVQIWFQNKRQSFRQTRSNNAHAVVGLVSHSHIPHLSSGAHPPILGGSVAAGGPGTFGSIQLTSAPGSSNNTPSASSDAYGNGNGSTGGGYFSPTADRGGDDSSNTSGGESNGRRYR